MTKGRISVEVGCIGLGVRVWNFAFWSFWSHSSFHMFEMLCRGRYKAIKRKLNQNCAFHLCPRLFTAAVFFCFLRC